tara:strand:+ start:1255 stop:1698 length:444 start_codon:yes stop_codon:yes gene_type:complete
MAVPADEDAIFFLLLGMAEENTKHPVTVQKSLDTIRQVIASGGAAVVEDDGEIIGSMGIGPKQAWFSNYTFLGDYWFYVRQDKRSLRAALLLKKTAQDVAKGVHLDLVFAVFSTTDAERKSKFFARDMTFLGGAYVMEVEKTDGMCV